jgi:ketosteroid isomerase-like protein
MRRTLIGLSIATSTGVALLAQAGQASDPQAIQRMAATERAFAASALEIGVRDAFLTFFAEDSISIVAGATGAAATTVPARAELAKRPLQKLPLAGKLMWEPFTGHVSSDGTLGWLTGGYVLMDQSTTQIAASGAYFSVWKRQDNGTWRVWLDEGIALPDVWRDASPFRAAPEPDTATGGSPTESIDAAERDVGAGGDPWRARLSAGVRLHRDGRMPFVGREAVIDWTRGAIASITYTVVKTEAAKSGDLAVTLGGYDATAVSGRKPEHGTWVRVWKRDVVGNWRIVFETSKPAK